MSKKKLAGIIAACAIVITVVILIVIFHPWRPSVIPPPLMYSVGVNVSPSGAGSVSLSPSGGQYESGVQVTLTASPARGYRFVNWTGDVGTVANVNSASAVISMNDDYSITANFALEIIEIRDWYDLDAVRDNLSGNYLLMNDLDSTTGGYMELASETANGGKGWEPIGTSDYGFTGNFNGQGYEIRDLFINRADQDYVGLFAHVSWIHPIENVGLIENVGVVNADVTGYYRVGVLVGHNAGIVNNSYSTCSVISGGYYVGGLVGYNDGGFVSNAYSTGNVTGDSLCWRSGGTYLWGADCEGGHCEKLLFHQQRHWLYARWRSGGKYFGRCQCEQLLFRWQRDWLSLGWRSGGRELWGQCEQLLFHWQRHWQRLCWGSGGIQHLGYY